MDGNLIQPFWQNLNKLELNVETFLSDPWVRETMYPLAVSSEEIDIFEFSPFSTMYEPELGGKVPYYHGYSANWIRQAVHLQLYKKNYGLPDHPIHVIEWGGGYGCMASMFMQAFPTVSYTIIDIPAFSNLQRQWLDRTMPQVGTTSDPDKVAECDLFISTWALSESSSDAIDYVVNEREFFGAHKVLTAFQQNDEKFPFAESFGDKLNKIHIPWIAGSQFYGVV